MAVTGEFQILIKGSLDSTAALIRGINIAKALNSGISVSIKETPLEEEWINVFCHPDSNLQDLMEVYRTKQKNNSLINEVRDLRTTLNSDS